MRVSGSFSSLAPSSPLHRGRSGAISGEGRDATHIGFDRCRFNKIKLSVCVFWELQDLSLSPVSGLGPEIVDFGGLHGPLLPQNTLGKAGGEALHLFRWVLQ